MRAALQRVGRFLHRTTSILAFYLEHSLTLWPGKKACNSNTMPFVYFLPYVILHSYHISPFIWIMLCLRLLPFGRFVSQANSTLAYVQRMQTLCSRPLKSSDESIPWNKPIYLYGKIVHAALSNRRVNASYAHIIPLNKWVISSLCILNNLLMSRAVFTLISFHMLISLFIWTYKPWTLYK